jgi:hypothetical protein
MTNSKRAVLFWGPDRMVLWTLHLVTKVFLLFSCKIINGSVSMMQITSGPYCWVSCSYNRLRNENETCYLERHCTHMWHVNVVTLYSTLCVFFFTLHKLHFRNTHIRGFQVMMLAIGLQNSVDLDDSAITQLMQRHLINILYFNSLCGRTTKRRRDLWLG